MADGNGGVEYWRRNWQILTALFFLTVFGVTMRADVDKIKETIGEPGSLPVIQYKIEQQDERVKRIEILLEKQADERDKLLDVVKHGQEKLDSMLELLMKEREKGK